MPTILFRAFANSRPKGYQFVLLLAALSASLGLLRFDTIPVGSFFDDAHYIVLAESISSGLGYRLISYPHMPVEPAFPPGWPLLLTPIVTLFPANFTLLKLLSFGFWLATIPLTYRLFRTRLRTPYLEMLITLVALNSHLVGLSGTVMSEAAFLFFSLLALSLFGSWNRQRDKRWLLATAVVAALFTVMVRTIGVALLGALMLSLLLQWRQRRLVYLGSIGGLIILGLIPLTWFNSQADGSFIFSPSYNQHLAYVIGRLGYYSRVWEHLDVLSAETVASALVPIFETQRLPGLITPFLTRLLSIVLLLVVLGGFLVSARTYQAEELYVVLYAAILYLWTVYVGHVQPRLLIPLIPFLYFYLTKAITWPGGYLVGYSEKRTALLTLTLLSPFFLLSLAANYHAWLNPLRDQFFDLSVGTVWVKENTAVDAIVMTADPVPDYLYARRQTVPYPRQEGDLEDYIRRSSVNYVIVKPHLLHRAQHKDAYIQGQLLPFLQATPDRFQEVYLDPVHRVSVYRVLTTE